MQNLGIVLTGGGARTAFQVGVINAINEWYPTDQCPFNVISGISGGSINAAFLASNADQFNFAAHNLNLMWRKLRSKHVYNSSIITTSYVKTLLNLFKVIRFKKQRVNSILNSAPLIRTLSHNIDFKRIQFCLDQKKLHSLAISSINYQNQILTTFVQSNQSYQWERAKRNGVESHIEINHLMASSSIPFLFSPIKIDDAFYGDGSIKNNVPLSSAIHSGADALLIIGNGKKKDALNNKGSSNGKISFGDVFSSILNILMNDSIDVDSEHIERLNELVRHDENNLTGKYKHIDSVYIKPSIDFTELADVYHYECPQMLQQLLRLIGTKHNSGYLKSYLMFEPGYINALIDQGYKDAQEYKDDIINLVNKSSRVGGDNPREL